MDSMQQAIDRIEVALGDRRATAAALCAAMADMSGAPAPATYELVDQVQLWFRAAERDRARLLTAAALAERAFAVRRRASLF